MKKGHQLLALMSFFSVFHASALAYKSTEIGQNSHAPKNTFLTCTVEHGLKAAFGNTRSVFAYSMTVPVPIDAKNPTVVSLRFISADTASARERLQVYLTSTDTQERWRMATNSWGEIFYYSSGVSSAAQLISADGQTLLAKFDISDCE